MRGQSAVAIIPASIVAALVWLAVSEDAYRDNGNPYWTSRPDERGYLVVAVAINLIAATVTLSTGFLGRPRSWVGAVLTIVGLLAAFVALVVMVVN